MFKGHLLGIKFFFEEGNVTNVVWKSLNSKAKLVTKRAREYKNVNNFMDMIHYINVGECLRYPQKKYPAWGYCASQGMYYYGYKLYHRRDTLL